MRYHLRLWLRAALVQLLVLALTALMCAAVSVTLLIDEVAGNRLASLETLDAYVQKVFYAAQRELIAMGERADWLDLARRSAQIGSGQDSLAAREEISAHLIEAVAGDSYFETVYFITPQHLFTSRFSNILMQMSQNGPSQWLRDGAQMHNTLTLSLGMNSYLVAQLNMEQAFLEDGENLYVMNHEGDCIYAVAQSAYAQDWFEENAETMQAGGARGRLYAIGGRLYRLVAYESVPYGRLYLSLTAVEDIVRASKGALKEVFLVGLALAALMPAALYFASRLAMRPVRQMAARVRRETTMEALSAGQALSSRVRGHLRRRVMGVFLLTLVPVVIMTLSTFSIFSKSNVQYTQELYRLSMTKAAQNVGFSYSQLLRQAVKIRSNADLMDWLEADGEGGASREELLEIVVDLMSGMDGVTGMRMYGADGRVLLSTTSFGEMLTDAMLDAYRNSYRYITVSAANLKNNDLAILFPLRVSDPGSGSKLFSCAGYVELHSEAPTVGNLVNAVTTGQELWYLYDSASWRLLDVPMTTAHRSLIEGMAQGGLIAEDGQSSMRILNVPGAGDYLLISEIVPNTSWRLIALLSSDFVSSAETFLGAAMVMLAAVLILAFTGMSNLFTQRFMRSVWRLVRFFTTATPRNCEMPLELKDEGEVTLIAREFEGALTRINQLEEMERRQQEENLYLEKRKRDAEIVALQSQLDSHLISNLFASMQLLLRMKETEALGETLRVVACFFRNEMAMDTLDVPLAREIALTKSYAEVQKTRFHDALKVEWAPYDPALERLIVPKFIMQPVLENAIKHGMSADRALRIRIALERADGRLSIVIANDGCPLEENRIEPINQRIDDTAPTTHIGLRNIMERLRLRYGAESGVRLSTGEDGWIRVHIWLPCQEDRDAVQTDHC